MAKNHLEPQVSDEPIMLDVQLSKTELFLEENWKKIAAVLGAVIIIVLGIYGWKQYMGKREAEAQKAIAAAQTAFASQQFEQAINGDGKVMGFLKIMDEYSGTKTANLAKLYAGLSYANLFKTDEAIKYLEDFSAQDDQMVSPSAIAALGNCYVQKGQNDKGAELLIKAAEKADNDAVSPTFLLQAGEIYEAAGNNDKAVELYTKIKKQYFRSMLAQDIDKYIERATK